MLSMSVLSANYQILAIAPVPYHQPIRPDEIATLTLPPELDLNREVILYGQVPTWVYGALVVRCESVPWIGCFAIQEKEAVVIQSRVPERSPGDVVSIALNRPLAPVILIGGPPNSGKSVLSNALRQSLIRHSGGKQVYLLRANWDGEGNWSHESVDQALMKRLIREHERRIHEHPDAADLLPAYFNSYARATANVRQVVDGVLVDVGGKTQPEKLPILNHCTHYVIISRDPEQVQGWHEFCQPKLRPLAVVHSVREERLEIVQSEPWLEIVAGPWDAGETLRVPDCLLEKVWTVFE
jgi:CRISPR-associated protein Csx3